MSLWAIVPVKPLRRGKSRLSSVLSEDERTYLNFSMLSTTLKNLAAVPEIARTLVVSRDPSALALAREFGARTLLEDGNPGLNTALRRATVVAKMYGAEGVLILPADLPLLQPEDLQQLMGCGAVGPVVVISPDQRKRGTNAMLVRPPELIDYSFGPGSFRRHCEKATRAGARLEVCEIPNIALDLDLPEDLELVREIHGAQLNI